MEDSQGRRGRTSNFGLKGKPNFVALKLANHVYQTRSKANFSGLNIFDFVELQNPLFAVIDPVEEGIFSEQPEIAEVATVAVELDLL